MHTTVLRRRRLVHNIPVKRDKHVYAASLTSSCHPQFSGLKNLPTTVWGRSMTCFGDRVIKERKFPTTIESSNSVIGTWSRGTKIDLHFPILRVITVIGQMRAMYINK